MAAVPSAKNCINRVITRRRITVTGLVNQTWQARGEHVISTDLQVSVGASKLFDSAVQLRSSSA